MPSLLCDLSLELTPKTSPCMLQVEVVKFDKRIYWMRNWLEPPLSYLIYKVSNKLLPRGIWDYPEPLAIGCTICFMNGYQRKKNLSLNFYFSGVGQAYLMRVMWATHDPTHSRVFCANSLLHNLNTHYKILRHKQEWKQTPHRISIHYSFYQENKMEWITFQSQLLTKRYLCIHVLLIILLHETYHLN